MDNIVTINTKIIKLDQFLKFAAITQSGGDAKELISSGEIKVNGEIETRRGRQLKDGDIIEIGHLKYQVAFSE